MIIELETISSQENYQAIVPVILSENQLDDSILQRSFKSLSLRVKHQDLSQWAVLLNKGIDRIIFSPPSSQNNDIKLLKESIHEAGIPLDRLVVDLTGFSDLNDPASLLEVLDGFPVVAVPGNHAWTSATLPKTVEWWVLPSTYSLDSFKRLSEAKFKLWLHSSKLTLNPESQDKFDLVPLLMSRLSSDRQDGLITTLVVDEQHVALGVCYSNSESLRASLKTGQGVYFSRKRGLWHKGLSSGATQQLISVDWDCDADTLRFTVVQKDPGFCHLNTRTCFGNEQGIAGLYQTLRSRKETAPVGSYTKRLFNDSELLTSKILEEAQELCDAKEHDEIAWETADLFYFALVKCAASNVSLADIESHLNLRSKKITRRPGNAKPKKETQTPSVIPEPSDSVKEEYPGDFRMRVKTLDGLDSTQISQLMQRPIIKTEEIMERVKPIVSQVRQQGDKGILELTAKFDRVSMDSVVLKAPFHSSMMQISDAVKSAIDVAYSNIEKFHKAQLDTAPLVVETMPGVVCSRFLRPIERVGLYIPGGTAVLPSTALMLGIPAQVAGCKEIVFATPPRPDGSICPEVVYVAHKVGATTIVKAGGAQAVAAMAYGTETVPKVDKICGPGNQYVTAAKMIAQSDSSALLSIDMPAGPSELLVIADSTADPRYIVSDLLSQAEHGVDSQVVLVAVSLTSDQIEAIQTELVAQATALSRSEIVKVSLTKSYLLCVKNMEQAINFSNSYAPEHLILNVDDASKYLDKIMNAGSVFVGPYSPESCGDYASGTNHTLPTYGYSKMYSGVNTHTFLKHITSQTLTREGLNSIGDSVVTLADVEGLQAHGNAVSIRLSDIRKR